MQAERLTGRERELLAQLINVRRRETLLMEQNYELHTEIERLKLQTSSAMQERLKHALKELESTRKRCNPRLSNEEWKVIQDMRGICS